VKPSDLNRQLLVTHDWLGKPRIESARRRLLDLNPRLTIETLDENLNTNNVGPLMQQADLAVDCAPLFSERFAMNDSAMEHRKPLVECAMFELEFRLFCVKPGESACLRCLYPEEPAAWRREFPVFGAVSGAVACLGAMEAIKILAGIGSPMFDRMLVADLRDVTYYQLQLHQRPDCVACRRCR
jgi:molybdopterin/thiamine biosynthesis adenylyltransferase